MTIESVLARLMVAAPVLHTQGKKVAAKQNHDILVTFVRRVRSQFDDSPQLNVAGTTHDGIRVSAFVPVTAGSEHLEKGCVARIRGTLRQNGDYTNIKNGAKLVAFADPAWFVPVPVVPASVPAKGHQATAAAEAPPQDEAPAYAPKLTDAFNRETVVQKNREFKNGRREWVLDENGDTADDRRLAVAAAELDAELAKMGVTV